mmetsp:Transcript_9566/g.14498  ORF Transcript_9566/g.14498 Transcript_9566/m.14498 type:complete len:210 (+) Transcript_9566:66-695(+)
MIAQNKLKKYSGSEEAPEESDSAKAIIHDYDFKEGTRSGKIIRAEMVARYKLKKLVIELDSKNPSDIRSQERSPKEGLDVENNRPTSEMRNIATRMMTTMELGRRLSCDYDLNKHMTFQLFPSDVRNLQLVPSENNSQAIPKEGLDAENNSPSKHVDRENTSSPHVHDGDFNNRPSPEMKDKATKMMRAMELGRRLSCEFDLNKNMMFK